MARSEPNQAFLVNEEWGEGILANPHPPHLQCPAMTESHVSVERAAWRGAAP